MTYAPGIEEFIARTNQAMPPDFYTLPVDRQRELYRGLTVEFPYPLPEGVDIADDTLRHGGRSVPVRVYRPRARAGRGVLLYLRGGGFVVGDLDTHQSVAAELAADSGTTVVAADFRMAPEHPFPAGLEDAYTALCALAAGPEGLDADPGRIVVCGDSSGANMAVVLGMMARDRQGPALAGQALISPVLDFSRWRHGGADTPLLTGGEMEYYTACYCPDAQDAVRPYVSPLCGGTFHGLPPAYVMAAEMDGLLSDSVLYAQALREQGVPVEIVVEPGLVHAAVRARALAPAVADAWLRFCVAAGRLAGSRP